jgi:hypothetical protein
MGTPASGGAVTAGGGGIGGGASTSTGTKGTAGTGGWGTAGARPAADPDTVCTMSARLDAKALELSTFDCVTSPSSPGLPTRTETLMLHMTQLVGTAGAGLGASEHAHCQFQIQTLDSAGAAGGVASVLWSQFHDQFQTQI